MGARTQGCTSMCTRWADRGASSLQPGKPSANGGLDISCHLFVHMVFAPCSGVTYLGFEVFDGGSYPRLHFLVHSSLPYIRTHISPIPFGALFSGFGALQKSGFPKCELLRYNWPLLGLGRPGAFWMPFFWDLHTYIHTYIGPFKKAVCQYVSW